MIDKSKDILNACVYVVAQRGGRLVMNCVPHKMSNWNILIFFSLIYYIFLSMLISRICLHSTKAPTVMYTDTPNDDADSIE